MNFNAVLQGCVVPADEILMMTVQIQTLLRKVLPLCESDNATNLADNSRNCWRLLTKCFDGWDVSLATNLSVSLLTWTMITSRNV